MSIGRILTVALTLSAALSVTPNVSYGQSYGVELGSSLMPASGGMGSASVARPQDLQSSLMNNPATLTQKKGTQFSFSGAWAEPTINIDTQADPLLVNIQPYAAKSQRPGSIVGNIAVTQDYSALGLPATVGVGLLTGSGLGINYRQDTNSNGTTAEFTVLATAVGTGVQITDRLSLGILGSVSTATLDGVFTGISSETVDYNMRGSIGLAYDCGHCTSLGAFWKTEEKYTFDDFVRLPIPNSPFQDVKVSLPNTYGVGIANQSLFGGKLLLAVDLVYYNWEDTDLFGASGRTNWWFRRGFSTQQAIDASYGLDTRLPRMRREISCLKTLAASSTQRLSPTTFKRCSRILIGTASAVALA